MTDQHTTGGGNLLTVFVIVGMVIIAMPFTFQYFSAQPIPTWAVWLATASVPINVFGGLFCFTGIKKGILPPGL